MNVYYWAAVFTIAAMGATAFPFVRRLVRSFLRFPKVTYHFIGVFVRAVHLVDHELTNNNGSSLKDQVEKIAEGQEKAELWMAGHDGLHRGLNQRGAWAD